MPVDAAAPEKITPLIKRLRESLGFTDIAPFSCSRDACIHLCWYGRFSAYIATWEAIIFRPEKQLDRVEGTGYKARNTGVSERCLDKNYILLHK